VPDGIQRRFLLLLNDMPGVREVFGRFTIDAVETIYAITKRRSAVTSSRVPKTRTEKRVAMSGIDRSVPPGAMGLHEWSGRIRIR
jgi:hypothetical protein